MQRHGAAGDGAPRGAAREHRRGPAGDGSEPHRDRPGRSDHIRPDALGTLMSLTLPDDVAWILNLLGFMWPEADEDRLRACAQAWRDFGSEVVRINQDARLVAVRVSAENSGDSIDAFEQYWHGVGGGGGDFERAKEAADHMATALDGMAMLVEGVKIAVLAQLGILAAEIIADQVAAPETLGLSEGVAAGEILVTRGIVRRIIQEGIHRVGREIVQQLKGRVLELFRRILATALRRAVAGAVVAGGMDLAKQEIDINVFHSRAHVDLTEVAGAAGTGASIGVIAPGARKGHGGRVVTRNGYRFTIDAKGRTTEVRGRVVANPKQGPNHKAQLAAGSGDRKPTDVGGHYVGRRFNGPLDDFNHFAQDGDFNNRTYRALENKWQKARDAGKPVYVVIKPVYPKDSLRPSELQVIYTIDGQPYPRRFVNGPQ